MSCCAKSWLFSSILALLKQSHGTPLCEMRVLPVICKYHASEFWSVRASQFANACDLIPDLIVRIRTNLAPVYTPGVVNKRGQKAGKAWSNAEMSIYFRIQGGHACGQGDHPPADLSIRLFGDLEVRLHG
jgi:hypothetical protein